MGNDPQGQLSCAVHSFADWSALWQRFDVAPPGAALFDRVLARYAEPHRHYHTLQHLDECLEQMSRVRGVAQHPGEIEMALWFHDAYFDQQDAASERRSADFAAQTMRDAGVDSGRVQRVHRLILGTQRDAQPNGVDSALVVDIDLASLAAPAPRFAECELQLRQENAELGDDVYRIVRRATLTSFLARPAIFRTRAFRAAFESRARRNIAARLRLLERTAA